MTSQDNAITKTSPRTLLHVYPTFEMGGAQRRFVQLANHFGAAYRHLIVSLNGGAAAFSLLNRDVDARLLDLPRRVRTMWASVTQFRAVLTALRPDLLVTSNWGSIEWAMANLDARTPHLHMEDGFGPEEAVGQLSRRVWTRRLVLQRSVVMVPSATLYRLARDVWQLPARRLVHVPNGIDCQRFTPTADDAFAAALGIAADRPVIGTVAALRPEKNLARLLDAFALIRRARRLQLVIVGDGPQRGELQQRAADLRIAADVLFTGTCAAPHRLLPSFSVFALSSDTEQMPISLLEAMACGRAVAATDVGDVRQMLPEINHPFVVAKDTPALAGALAALTADRPRASSIGAVNALHVRRHYDQDLMFAAYRTLYGQG